MRLRYRLLLVSLAIVAYIGLLVFFPWDQIARPRTHHDLSGARGGPAADILQGAVRWGLMEHRGKENASVALYQTIADSIGTSLGLQIKVTRARSYRALEERFLSGELDIASFSSFAYISLRDRQQRAIRPVAAETYQGSKYYVGYFFTRANSSIRGLADLRGRSFAFVSPNSASGYLFPLAHLRAQNIDAGSFFSRTVFSGSHPETLRLVRGGRVDAGVSFDASFQNAAPGEFRVLAKTAKVPGGVLCAGPRLPGNVIEALRVTLFRLSRENSGAMQDFRRKTGISGWAPVVNNDYEVVRRALDLQRRP